MFSNLVRRQPIRHVLMLVLVFTLLPLGVLAIVQAYGRLQREAAAADASLHSHVRSAAVIEAAVRWRSAAAMAVLARGLAAADAAGCRRQLLWALDNLPELEAMSIERQGQVLCTAGPAIARMTRTGGFGVTGGARPELSFTVKADGITLTATHDLDTIGLALRARLATETTVAFLTDAQGRVLVSTARPPPWRAVGLPPSGQLERLQDPQRRTWRLAAAPLTLTPGQPPRMWVVLAQRNLPLFHGEGWFALGYFAPPLLSVAMATLGVWIAANHSILRWIEALRQLARDMETSRGTALTGRFEDAPEEVRSLAASFLLLRRAMARRNAGLREALERQRALSLELHHRVGNNLQVIGSFLALAGQQQGPDVQGLELRLAALATVHKLHHQRGDLNTIRVASLLAALATSMERHGLAGRTPIALDVAPLHIAIDPASALALWVVELVTPGRNGVPLRPVTITLAAVGDEVLLTIAGEAPARPSRIAQGLAKQIGAVMQAVDGGTGWQLRIPTTSVSRPFVANAGATLPG